LLIILNKIQNKRGAGLLMENREKEVFFDKYCGMCIYRDMVDEKGYQCEQCEECLASPYNIDSHKPINYREL
jgi:methionyl-tRNA synthetase